MERPPLTTTVEGLPLSLTERDDGHWDMRNRVSSVSAPVTSYEARCLINAGKFAALGDPVESRGTSGPNAGLPTQAAYRDQLACWIDSTTLMASTSAVRRERTPAPGALFDLATLCFAVMCYDKILVDGQQVKVPDQLSNVIVPIDIRSGAGPNPGYTYASQVNDFAGRIRPDSFAELGVAWSEFLERPVELSFDAVDRATDSPGRWPYLPGDVFGVGWELPRKGSGGSLNTDASIQTWRYFINEHFASKHGVPYHCTSLRYPWPTTPLGGRGSTGPPPTICSTRRWDSLRKASPPSPVGAICQNFGSPTLCRWWCAEQRTVPRFGLPCATCTRSSHPSGNGCSRQTIRSR